MTTATPHNAAAAHPTGTTINGTGASGAEAVYTALRALRAAAGNPSLDALSQMTDPKVSATTVGRLFAGESLLSWRAFAAVANALGADADTTAALWRQAGQKPPAGETQSQKFRRQIPAYIGKKGISLLLDVAIGTVRDWFNASQEALAAGEHTWKHLPAPDREEDGNPMWFPRTIVAWAVRNRKLPRSHGLAIPALPETLWSQTDIARYFGVDLNTVKRRWRHHYVYAVRRNLKPPPKALPPETLDVEGVPLWDPPVVLNWGQGQGKLDADFNPYPLEGETVRRWVAPEPPQAQAPPQQRPEDDPDPVRRRLRLGEVFDRDAIAAYFRVKPDTVRMWLSVYGSGKDFPEHDEVTSDGVNVWEKPPVYAWGEREGRIVGGVVVISSGGRPVPEPAQEPAAA